MEFKASPTSDHDWCKDWGRRASELPVKPSGTKAWLLRVGFRLGLRERNTRASLVRTAFWLALVGIGSWVVLDSPYLRAEQVRGFLGLEDSTLTGALLISIALASFLVGGLVLHFGARSQHSGASFVIGLVLMAGATTVPVPYSEPWGRALVMTGVVVFGVVLYQDSRRQAAVSLRNRAAKLHDMGEQEAAIALLREEARLREELGDKAGLARSLSGRAWILRERGQLDEAVPLLKEAERLSQEVGDKTELARSLGIQVKVYEEQERLCREVGDKAGLARSLGSRAFILYYRLHQSDEAKELLEEQERLCRELGDKLALARLLGNLGWILELTGRPDEAMPRLKEQERLWRELGNAAEVQRALARQRDLAGVSG